MNRQDFDYQLPAELIAQHPAQQRSSSRLLQLGRVSGEISHRQFTDLLELVESNDLLVFNDTRVIPARLFGEKDTGGKIPTRRSGMTAILSVETSEDGFVGRMEMSEGMTDWSHISVVGTSGLRILTTNLFLHGEKVRICIRVLLVSVPATPGHIQTRTRPLLASKLA